MDDGTFRFIRVDRALAVAPTWIGKQGEDLADLRENLGRGVGGSGGRERLADDPHTEVSRAHRGSFVHAGENFFSGGITPLDACVVRYVDAGTVPVRVAEDRFGNLILDHGKLRGTGKRSRADDGIGDVIGFGQVASGWGKESS